MCFSARTLELCPELITNFHDEILSTGATSCLIMEPKSVSVYPKTLSKRLVITYKAAIIGSDLPKKMEGFTPVHVCFPVCLSWPKHAIKCACTKPSISAATKGL